MHRIAPVALRGHRRGRSPFVGAADLAMLPLRAKPLVVTAVDSTARPRPLARVPRAVVFSHVAARGRAQGIPPTKYALCVRVCATPWEIGMPDTEIPIPIAGARPREDAQSPAPRRPSRNRGPGSVKIAGHVSQAVHRELRMLGATQGRTVQSLPGEAFNELFRKHRAAAYRRGVGLGPRTRRPGADTPCAVVPPSSRIPGRRPVLFNRILAPARLRLRCDAACWPSDANTTVPGRTVRTCRQCSPRRA